MMENNVESNIGQKNEATIIALMGVYLSEWTHRDSLLWQQVFKYFYATLMIMLLPNLTSFLSLELPALPSAFFRIAGMIAAVFFLYVSIGYTKRLEASGDTYQKMINMLPEEFRRVPLRQVKHGKYFAQRMSTVICVLMFVLLISLGIILLII